MYATLAKVMAETIHSGGALLEKRKQQLSAYSPFHPSFLGFIYILYGQYLQRLFGRHTTLLSLLLPLHDGPPGLAKWLRLQELVYLYGNISTLVVVADAFFSSSFFAFDGIY